MLQFNFKQVDHKHLNVLNNCLCCNHGHHFRLLLIVHTHIYALLVMHILLCVSESLLRLLFYQVSTLLDGTVKEEFATEIAEEYEDISEDHYENLKVLT